MFSRARLSRILTVFLFIAIFLLILLCNDFTHFQGDDYEYLNSFKDGSRIESVWDIFESMYYHRISTNGRLIAHFFVQLFLMWPKYIFNPVNSGIFVLMIYFLYRFAFLYTDLKIQGHMPLLLCAIFALVWLISPCFGTVFLWLDGSCNYLWSYVLILPWLLIMCRDFLLDIKMSPWQEILFSLLCFVTGNYGENLSVSAIFMMALFIGLSRFLYKRPLKRWHILGMAAMLLGFFFLLTAPGTFANKIAKPGFEKYFSNLSRLLEVYISFWPLIVFYVLSLISSLRSGCDRDRCILSLVPVGGSLAALFVLVLGSYIAEYTTVLSMLLLMCACLIIFPGFFSRQGRSLICIALAVLMCFSARGIFNGLRDLYIVDYRWEYNEQLLQEAAANGKTKLSIPYIIPETEYSVYHVWGYIREDNTHRFNRNLAAYYGLEEVSGYWFYDLEY